MTRRIVRTVVQLASVGLLLLVAIFLLDNRYRVLPEKLHAYSPIHHHGHVVTDITVTTCSSLNVFSNCDMGADWQRIPKDIFLSKGWVSSGYVSIRRKKEEELEDGDRVVLDVRVGKIDPTTLETKHDENQWERRDGGIWLLRSAKRHASDSDRAVTAVDVLFGADAVEPRPGWEIKDHALDVSTPLNLPGPRLSIRRGEAKSLDAVAPKVRKDGKFKIAQLSDIHLATGYGVCRDEYPPTGHCDADVRTISFVSEILDKEKPDLAVLSGDVVNGETAPDAQSALFKIADLLIKRNIPWTIIFGNHDDEGSLSRENLMELATSLPLCLAERGPATLSGVGNYVVEINAATSSQSAITLYHLDTHAYSPDERRYPGYAWLKPDQLSWFRDQANERRASPAHKQYSRHHMDMAFVHIPLTEVLDDKAWIRNSGSWREGPTSPLFNSGFKDALVENGIVAVGFGHDHVNDFCGVHAHSDSAKSGHVWLCYAGGAGYGGYAGHDTGSGGFERRIRMWQFDMETAQLETWKRIDGHDGKTDLKRVMEDGKMVLE